MATTYETSSWDTYGKWTLIALLLAMIIAALIATVWGWEQGYFDTIIPTRRSRKLPSMREQAPQSLNFSSYRSTLNARLQGGASILPVYSPRASAPQAQGTTPEPTYKTGTPTVELEAHDVCPLPTSPLPNSNGPSEDNAWSVEDDLPPPEPAVRSNPWETVEQTSRSSRSGYHGRYTGRSLRCVENTRGSAGQRSKRPARPTETPVSTLNSGTSDSSTISAVTPSTGIRSYRPLGSHTRSSPQTPIPSRGQTWNSDHSTENTRSSR